MKQPVGPLLKTLVLCFACTGSGGLAGGLITFGAATVNAAEIALELPVSCELNKVCSIQLFYDHDPGPGRMDYACGRLTNDGHRETSFRVPDLPTMEQGIPVVAAAPGVVEGLRDGMRDVSVREIGQETLRGNYAGNGILIDHGNGWVTQYSHMKRGSIAVEKGQVVRAGQRLGLIGLSGNTEFPHLGFAVRYNGEEIDPFVGLGPFRDCGDPRQPLWSATALKNLDYIPTGPLVAGFATERPVAEAARQGKYSMDNVDPLASALVMWVDVYGVMRGDVQRFRIVDPEGRSVVDEENALEESNLSWFAFAGGQRQKNEWMPGSYRGTYTLRRGEEVVVHISNQIQVGASGDRAGDLVAAGELGDLARVETLFAAGVDVDTKNDDGVTALWKASETGHLEVVRALLDAGAEPNSKRSDGFSALMIATAEGHLEVVQALLDAGADANAAALMGVTALYFASNDGHLEVVKALLDANAKVDVRGPEGTTALTPAIMNNHPEVVSALIAAGADVNVSSGFGTPLDLAKKLGRTEIVHLLKKAGSRE